MLASLLRATSRLMRPLARAPPPALMTTLSRMATQGLPALSMLVQRDDVKSPPRHGLLAAVLGFAGMWSLRSHQPCSPRFACQTRWMWTSQGTPCPTRFARNTASILSVSSLVPPQRGPGAPALRQ